MNLIKRIKNLWKVSEYEPNIGQKLNYGDKIVTLYKPNQEIEIIKRLTPEEEFLQKTNE